MILGTIASDYSDYDEIEGAYTVNRFDDEECDEVALLNSQKKNNERYMSSLMKAAWCSERINLKLNQFSAHCTGAFFFSGQLLELLAAV